MRTCFAVAAIVAALSGCATPYTVQPVVISPRPDQVTDTEYDPLVSVGTAEAHSGNYFGAPETVTSLFSAYDKKNRTVRHSVLLMNHYGGRGWKFWSSASTSNAQSLPVTVLGRDVGKCRQHIGCDHTERLFADISDALMADAATNGLRVRFTNRNGDAWFADYTASQVANHLHILEKATAKYR